ncbi:hypothetical protein ACM65P_002639 [Vibrio alginolyticus]
MKTLLTISLTLGTAFTANASTIDDATMTKVKEVVGNELKDADSAKYKEVFNKDRITTCGLVNAKNSYGGYTGYKAFAIMHLPEDVSSSSMVIFDAELVEQACIE